MAKSLFEILVKEVKIPLMVLHEQQPLSEWDVPIGLRERGHHLPHIIEFFYIIFVSKKSKKTKDAASYAQFMTNEFTRCLLESQHKHTEIAQHLTLFKELESKPWFHAFVRTWLEYSFNVWMDVHKEDDMAFEYRHIDLQLKYSLAYLVTEIDANFFEKLHTQRGFFEADAREILLNGFQADPSPLNKFLQKHPEFLAQNFHDLINLVDYCEWVWSEDYMGLFISILNKGDLNIYRQILEILTKRQNEWITYYLELESDLSETSQKNSNTKSINFFSKIENLFRSKDEWIVLSTTPGLYCTKPTKNLQPECYRHCLRKQNADGDQEFLDLIALFLEEYPEFLTRIKVRYTNQRISEVALHPTIFEQKEFQSIFDNMYTYRSASYVAAFSRESN